MTMPGSVKTGDLTAQNTVELNDSCNCCWGRRVKKQKQAHKPATRALSAAEKAFADKISRARDADEVYDFHMTVDMKTRRNSDAEEKKSETKKPADDKA